MTRCLGVDTFKNGGELVDLRTWYAGRDKVQHAVAGFMLAAACRRAGLGRRTTLLIVLVAGIAMEGFEQVRYWQWQRRIRTWRYDAPRDTSRWVGIDAPPPRPQFCDTFSWRDIVAGLAGALLAMP